MDALIRTIAIILEVAILAGISYAILNGIRLAVFTAGIGEKYNKAITGLFFIVGIIVVVFFVAHLTAFYPAA
jgi:succinate dehydrogenase/fumarate reductase cytochrome b subunit